MKKAELKAIARRVVEVFEEYLAWDFYDAWSSTAEAVRCYADELDVDPVQVWNELDDIMSDLEPEEDLYHELINVQADVAEVLSSWLEAKEATGVGLTEARS